MHAPKNATRTILAASFALLAAGGTAVVATGAQAAADDTTRHLDTLKIEKTEDAGAGGDEPYLKVNGEEVWSVPELDSPGSASINRYVSAGSTVEVYDRDLGGAPDEDDLIGSFPVEGWGDVHLTNDGAHYIVSVKQ